MSGLWKKLFSTWCRLCREEQGAVASEYAIILGVVIVAAIAAIALFGLTLSDTTSAVYSGLANETDTGGGSFGPGNFRSGVTVKIP